MGKDKILLVEDDIEQSLITSMQLKERGYEVLCVKNGAAAEEHVRSDSYALIILDLLLPDQNGIDLCRKIRKQVFCPIVFISCIKDKQAIVYALKNGADDYVVKPVEYNELAARIEANIRRSRCYGKGERNLRGVIQCRLFVIDKDAHKVWRVDQEGRRLERIALSPTEYKLLVCFAENPNVLILYHELYRYIWQSDALGDVRTVMVHVSNLRKKIDFDGSRIIHTVRGAGYIFADRTTG